MAKIESFVRYICKCSFVDDDGKVVDYYRALVEIRQGGNVSYVLVKATRDWAEDFKGFGSPVCLYYDSRGRVIKSESLG